RSKRDWSSDVCSSDLVTVPVTLALLFAALLHPLVAWATGKGLGRATAAVAAVVLAVLVVLGVLAFVVQQSVAGGPELAAEFSQRSEERRVGKECSAV